MSLIDFKGIDVVATGARLVFEFLLLDAAGAKVTSGATTYRIFEIQDDADLHSYDFSDNTFKTTALTTATAALAHQQGNNNTYDTGIWTGAHTTLTDFTLNAKYIVEVSNSLASPVTQARKFQFGGGEGDFVVSSAGVLDVNSVQLLGDAQSATDLKDFADAGYDPATNKLQGVVLADTLTTYTGNTPQTGDNYAIVNSGVHGNAAIMTLLDAIGAYIDTEVAAIKAKTDNLPTDPADESQIQAAIADLKTYVDTEVAAILAAVDTEVAAIKAKTDNLPASPAAVSDVPTVAAISDGVWDEATAGHSTAGTTGKALTDAGGASDPWSTPLPGAYDPGEAGYILGTNLDQKISEIVGGPSQTIVVGQGVDCNQVQYFDLGEKKPVGSRLEASTGTLTITSVTVTLKNATGTTMYGINALAATGFDTGGVTLARAWYLLDLDAPPTGGPVAAGTYSMIFHYVYTTSDGLSRQSDVPVTIKVS